MRKIEHQYDVMIYEHTPTFMRASFFGKNKPEIGDMIESHMRKGIFVVEEIILNRDAKIAKGFDLNPKKAYFELKLKLA